MSEIRKEAIALLVILIIILALSMGCSSHYACETVANTRVVETGATNPLRTRTVIDRGVQVCRPIKFEEREVVEQEEPGVSYDEFICDLMERRHGVECEDG